MDWIAVISDVHGNMPALETVLSDIRGRGIELIYNLGDLVGKGPSSDQVVDLCREVCQVTVRGNWEDGLLRHPNGAMASWYNAQLGAARLAYIDTLKNVHDLNMSGWNIRLYHASAKSIYHRVHPDSGNDALREMFENTEFTGFANPVPDMVIYGDIHSAYRLSVDIGEYTHTLINAGSVGNPLDVPLASYLILKGTLDSTARAPLSVEFVQLPYDIESVILEAQRVGLPDANVLADELRTAVYQRRTKPT